MRAAALFKHFARAMLVFSVAMLAVSCGTDSGEETGSPTMPATQASIPAEVPEVSDEQADEKENGNFVTRNLRTGGSWVWSGLTWVWDRGSDGTNAVWDAINGAGSFLWSNVRNLPSAAWSGISGIWNWVWGTSVGEVVLVAIESVPELLANLNPSNLLNWIWGIIVRILLFGAILLLIVIGLIATYKFRFIATIRRVLPRREAVHSQKDRRGPVKAYTKLQPPMIQNVFVTSASTPHRDWPDSKSGLDLHWTREQIQELRTMASSPAVDILFELSRERAGGPIDHFQLVHATGLAPAVIGRQLSAFNASARVIRKDDHGPIKIMPPTDQYSDHSYFVPQPYLDWWFED